MLMLPPRTVATRFAILMCVVCAAEMAALFLTARPQIWCAIIPLALPTVLPWLIFVRPVKTA